MPDTLPAPSPSSLDTADLRQRASSLENDGHLAEAELFWRELSVRDPRDATALCRVAALLTRSGLGGNALVYLCRAIEAGSRGTETLNLARRVLLCMNGSADDKTDLSSEEAADAVVEMLGSPEIAGVWASARTSLVRLLVSAGVDTRLVEDDTASTQSLELVSVQEPDALLKLYHESRGDAPPPDTAATALEQLKSSGCNAEAWFVLGRDCLGRDDQESAQELFRKAAQLEPGRIKYRMNLARVLATNGHYAQAYQAYRTVMMLGPESRTDSFHQDEAAANRRSLLSRLILQVRQAVAEGNAERGWQLFQMISGEEDLPDADGMRSSVLRISIDRVMAAHKKGEGDVIVLARQHLERDPSSVYVRQVLGQALMAADRYREAAEVWGSLTASMPENARVQLQYAKCLERTGAGEAALAAAVRAMELDPSLESAQIIRDRLSS